MTSALCAAVVCSGLVLAGAEATTASDETYAAAHRETIETGKPLLVMVGTDWCGPCQTMKRTVLPRLRKRGVFKKIVFALVNPDRNRELAEDLTGGGPVPQLVMYRKTSKGWMRRVLVGGQSEDAVERFIKDGLADDEAEKDADGGERT
ncbi:MAG: thioredoxin family protein [Pirellulales bacterium]|nr:thioredoxin family protein [Pirellulales bacterium]